MKKLLVLFALSVGFLTNYNLVFSNEQVVINEILPSPSSGNDWVELYNPQEEDVDISSWILDDEGTSTNMLTIPQSTVIAPKSYKIFYVSNRLNKSGDTVYLKDGNTEIDKYQYSLSETDVSIGRYPDGTADWANCTPTQEAANINCQLPKPEEITDNQETSPSSTNKLQSPSPTINNQKAAPSPLTSKTSKTSSPAILGIKQENFSSNAPLLSSRSPLVSPQSQAEATASAKSSPLKVAAILSGSGAVLIGLSTAFYLWYYKSRQNKAGKTGHFENTEKFTN